MSERVEIKEVLRIDMMLMSRIKIDLTAFGRTRFAVTNWLSLLTAHLGREGDACDNKYVRIMSTSMQARRYPTRGKGQRQGKCNQGHEPREHGPRCVCRKFLTPSPLWGACRLRVCKQMWAWCRDAAANATAPISELSAERMWRLVHSPHQ